MKNWINRLLSGTEDGASPSEAAASHEHVQGHGEPADEMSAGIDAAYYRWLTGARGYDAPPDIENLILEQVLTLSRNAADAAELVPRVPELIPQLLLSLRDDGVTTGALARQVAQDVVLMAEVIREANSAYYRPITPVKTIEAAIMMLGQNGLRMLLARLAFRPLIKMQSTGFARGAALNVWNQSEKCALAASLMAPGLTAGVFESYLAGLMQNVGLLVAFRLADRVCPTGSVPGSTEFGARLLACSRQLSATIATHWDFPQEVAQSIAHAGAPDGSNLARALAQGDRIAKLRMLIDASVLDEDDPLVAEGLDNFQRRCLGKLAS
ncbi:HDOD domain-containing protein [Massilia horti]|uniref:HDOD domain-containing protein n=1 Tax=Massilia horti TaxID=2562153 RepID=A0A4Y9T079_9BURK|nr:HDOD domain-containing protein [Massilia horti]TFW31013.1 HDOD domain-containing protein [Massilia horti]